ncbi:InlB B-repeat-containing protein [Faecalibacterium prausnitzii]|uniref:InlB B-repeat-containing protein n=1 Tax=Faecalibacterium prausnitzii TaxID=853 RepID=UPI00311A9969
MKDGGAVADLTAVPVGTELVATADEDTETSVFKNWNCTGLELTEEQRTARVVYFTMPDHDVNLVAEFVTPTKPDPAPENYKLIVSYAKVTLKDGSAVADLMAVPVGTELKATADEDTETSVFKSWSCTGLELTEEQRTARVVYFTMPDHDVNLVAEFVTPTKPDPAPETYKLIVSYAKITLKDGSAVADLKAVPMGTELKATADEDTETRVFKNWNCTGLELTEEQRTAHEIYFTMPDHDVELTAVFEVPATPDPDPTPDPKPNPDPTPAPGGDSDGGGAAIVAVAAVGGAAIGVGAYIAGTTAYLKSVLPEGMAIPANRQQLAVALWTAAGKPATQSTALFNDVAADAAELQAIRWVVDTGLMSAQDGSFKPGSRVGRMEVIRTWKTYQQRG